MKGHKVSIASNPSKAAKEARADDFIGGAGKKETAPAKAPEPGGEEKKAILLRFDAQIMRRVHKAAKRLGTSQNAFFSVAVVEKLEQMQM